VDRIGLPQVAEPPAGCQILEHARIKMSFLKQFFQNVLQAEETNRRRHSSFESLSEEDLEAHMRVCRYDNFRLTEAVRPSYDLRVKPVQGYRFDTYRDEQSKVDVPVLMAAASAEILFDLLMESLDPLGADVDVVLETSHYQSPGGHRDLYREHIDLPVLKSVLWDFEEMLLNDGCTGLAVINPQTPQEVQFDEHKLLIFYGEPLGPFEDVLRSRGLRCLDDLRFITEAEHVHSSKDEFRHQFDDLKTQLGIDGWED
jgi:hypothetical protein